MTTTSPTAITLSPVLRPMLPWRVALEGEYRDEHHRCEPQQLATKLGVAFQPGGVTHVWLEASFWEISQNEHATIRRWHRVSPPALVV
ncbi:MAG: hypothetical protein ACRDS0_41205 [Pseudonocardiaceae bacterium]